MKTFHKFLNGSNMNLKRSRYKTYLVKHFYSWIALTREDYFLKKCLKVLQTHWKQTLLFYGRVYNILLATKCLKYIGYPIHMINLENYIRNCRGILWLKLNISVRNILVGSDNSGKLIRWIKWTSIRFSKSVCVQTWERTFIRVHMWLTS